MSPDTPLEEILKAVNAMDRQTCKAQLHSLDRPPLDFTDELRDRLSIERLRHILMAAYIQAHKKAPQHHH